MKTRNQVSEPQKLTASPHKDFSKIIGTKVKGHVDRPIGSRHPRHPDIIYPINYGYVDGVFAGDGEEQDVYIFGTDHPLKTFSGTVIGVYHRQNDNEDKWIVMLDETNSTKDGESKTASKTNTVKKEHQTAAPLKNSTSNTSLPTRQEILEKINFQEQYFEGKLYLEN